jgi:uncharacterized phage protein (TIGR02218 family)
MATLAELEQSIESSRPIELYTIVVGSTTYRYTSSEGSVSFGGSDYVPIAGLKRSKITQAKEQKSTVMTVQIPSANDVAQEFVAIQPSTQVTIRVNRIQPDAIPAASLVIFDGYISGVAFKNRIAEMRCVPFNEQFNRETPRFQYQGLCNHVLYDNGCTINEALHKYSGTVIGIGDGTQIDIAGLPSADTPYIGGYLELPDKSEQRLIIDQSGSVVTILLPFKASISGGTIDAYEGCDHTPQTCARKFSNILNYGGYPFVPTSNPFNLTQFTKE